MAMLIARLLYNLALLLLSPLILVYMLVRMARGKSRRGWRDRLGRPELPAAGGRRVWVHCASVGEVVAATPVIAAYRVIHPADEIVMSVITPGGHEVASKLVGKHLAAVFYSPFDFTWAARSAMNLVRPALLVVLETELWPNLLWACHDAGVPAVLVNGRMSDRSAGGYRRARSLFRHLFPCFAAIEVQSSRDRDRYLAAGADPLQVVVGGNSKFDQDLGCLDVEAVAALRADLRLPDGAPVLVVGSTRSVEEERLVLDAYQLLLRDRPNLALVHAPRHVDRAEEVAGLMSARGLHPVRRTQMAAMAPGETAQQVILDTFGELARVYAVATVAFVGNSLVPSGAGQSLLQPLAQGKPVLFGPYVSDHRDAAALALADGVGFAVHDAAGLAQVTAGLLADEPARSRIAVAALQLVRSNRGASQRFADLMARAARPA